MKPLALAATIALTFCANAALADNIKPGLWEITTQMGGNGMPAMPAIPEAQRKQMEAMGVKMPQMAGGGAGVSTQLCVTAEQAKSGVPPTSREDIDCKQTEVKTSGKTTNWKFVCTGKHKASGSGFVTFDSPERYSGESTIQMQESAMGPMTVKNKFTGKWLATACK